MHQINSDHIDHLGVVDTVDSSQNTVRIRINNHEECCECPASKLCEAYGHTPNIVTVTTTHASAFKKGDEVTVRGTERMHHKAIMYATVLPCIILVAVMVGIYITTANQLAAAISGLGVTIVFYALLWICRNKIAHEFSFSIIGKQSYSDRPGQD